jgi:hypothetical protein
MFINLSNHHSSKWSQKQLDEAQKSGMVTDVPFPQIDPYSSMEEVEALAKSFWGIIINMIDNDGLRQYGVVHLMGEQSFCFALTQLLIASEIPVCVSTTQRVAVVENGEKISKFEFVQFRLLS